MTTRETPPSTAPDPGRGLRRGSIAFAGTVGSSVGIQAPAGGVSFLPALMAGIVGIAGPAAFASAVVVMLFVAYAFVVFSREFATSGSVYTFGGRAVGPRFGLFTAWLLLLVYIAYAASVFASNANALVTLLAPGLAGGPGWLLFAAAMWLLTILVSRSTIRISTALIFGLEAVALVLVAIVAVVVLAKQGGRIGALGGTPFNPGGVPLGLLGPGIVFAFTGFSGFEVATTLGEEARAPRRLIPIAMVVALIVSGGIYTLLSYVETVAYPSAATLAAAGESGVPLADIANRFVGSGFGTVITIAAIISGLGAQFATVNGATRLLFTAARAGVAPRSLGSTHPVLGTPTRALGVVAVATIVPVLALGFRSPLEAFADLATTGADLIVVAYLLTLVAAVVHTVRSPATHPVRLGILVVGILLIGYVIDVTVVPFPDGELRAYLIASGVAIVVGLVLAFALGRRRDAATRFLAAAATTG